MKEKYIKCIVIGGGRIALSHLPHLLCNPYVKVVGIVEPNRLSRFVLSKLFRIKIYPSIESIKYVEYDSAFVLTPPNSHFGIAKLLLKMGKHVFLEKPMTLDPNESMELLCIAKKKNIYFTSGYVYRHHPIFREIKRILTDKVYGTPTSCKISMRGNVVNANSPISWRNVGKGAGCLYDYGCHVIDLSIFLFGKPHAVKCLSKEEIFQAGVIDRFYAELKHNDFVDVNSHIECDWSDENSRKAGLYIEIDTQDYKIFTDGQTITLSGAASRKYSVKDLDTNVNFYLRGEEFQRQTDAFFMTIAEGVYDYLDAEHAAYTDAVILQIYEKVL